MNGMFHHLIHASPLIAMLVVMEGLLSVDSVLAIASLASELPETQRRGALKFGLLAKFSGSAAIIVLCLWHEHSPALRRVRRWVSVPVMVVLRLYEKVLRTMLRPLRGLARGVRAHRAKAKPGNSSEEGASG